MGTIIIVAFILFITLPMTLSIGWLVYLWSQMDKPTPKNY